MTYSPVEEGAATKTASEDPEQARKSDAAQTVNQKLDSLVVTFDANDEIILPPEDDGTFDLNITPQGDITGSHVHPSSNGVHGSLHSNVIDVTSDDGLTRHTGVLVANKFFIGRRIPLGDKEDQEEGVWVGTKKP